MIQDIAPHVYDPSFRSREPENLDFVLHYEADKVLLLSRGERLVIPSFGDFFQNEDIRRDARFLFCIDDRAYYGVMDLEVPESGGFVMERLLAFRSFEPHYQAFAGITGSQLCRWMKNRRFCGCCGKKTEFSHKERAMVCPDCGLTEYPKICPAVIVAITNEDKLLLTRYAKGAYRNYALVAGFVEIGETFEDCVHREVMEEVGLKVKNIRYFKSQPWAFSDTEMIGFTAELDGDDTICLEEEELSEAGWFTRKEIGDGISHISVGHELIEAFKDGRIGWNRKDA